jgi:hypothetical protein
MANRGGIFVNELRTWEPARGTIHVESALYVPDIEGQSSRTSRGGGAGDPTST